jgi:hypothetical protein
VKITSLLLVLLAGCVTPYQYSGATGGFEDIQLAPDVFRISFQGNGYTSAERVQDFGLLRACQLTLTNGFICFAILGDHNSATTMEILTPGVATSTAIGSSVQTVYTPGQRLFVNKPRSALMIQAFVSKPTNTFTFDARFMETQITNHYDIDLTKVSYSNPPRSSSMRPIVR